MVMEYTTVETAIITVELVNQSRLRMDLVSIRLLVRIHNRIILQFSRWEQARSFDRQAFTTRYRLKRSIDVNWVINKLKPVQMAQAQSSLHHTVRTSKHYNQTTRMKKELLSGLQRKQNKSSKRCKRKRMLFLERLRGNKPYNTHSHNKKSNSKDASTRQKSNKLIHLYLCL